MKISFQALPTNAVEEIRRTGRDSYGNLVERKRLEAPTYPCRHCLEEIPADEDVLILAHRPFRRQHAYAETGPIFLCGKDCARAEPSQNVPEILRADQFLVRGYDGEERIVYGTGRVIPTRSIADYSIELLSNLDIAFVDVRSAANNCYQCRIVRA